MVWTLSGDVTRSSAVLYREYGAQDGNLDAWSVANILRGVLGTRVNPDSWFAIHVTKVAMLGDKIIEFFLEEFT